RFLRFSLRFFGGSSVGIQILSNCAVAILSYGVYTESDIETILVSLPSGHPHTYLGRTSSKVHPWPARHLKLLTTPPKPQQMGEISSCPPNLKARPADAAAA